MSKRYSRLLTILTLLVALNVFPVQAQLQYELKGGWQCAPVSNVKVAGELLSKTPYALSGWEPAVVPGTVLTTMLENKKVPDPFYGLNNEKIPDMYKTGRDYYTYWFVKDFQEAYPSKEQQVWLHLRGVNYSCDVYLNGHKLNATTHTGMFLRQTYNITSLMEKEGNNRLAVIVYPPTSVGNPNGGQGGDGTVARNVAHQYVAGWDWIQPIRDRNTGIWDKVFIEKTASINLKNPHIVTLVPGKRKPEGPQQPATIKVTAELENPTAKKIQGTLRYSLDGNTVSQSVTLAPQTTVTVVLPDLSLKNPKLWWPSGYGPQNQYASTLQFLVDGKTSDQESISVGVRQIDKEWNSVTRSMQVMVNGQKIFIKGGNWIISDAMLRFTDARYDAEIRFHRDMNLNLIRIWGGALPERPEFYQACDKYGMLVMQDFWMSGDCNGRWLDPMKLDDQWTRRNYPDNHSLFLESARDQIKMIRNHPSLAIWCGGNEITPPEDILTPLRDSILPQLDGTRWFIEYSNSDSMSYNSLGGNGDGPYGIQPIAKFWEERTFPFNSEVGSVGVGDYESLERFIPKENLVAPTYPSKKLDPVWDYHKYIGYDQYIQPYGVATDAKDFAKKAQLVNYDQYRALMEGFSAHMWEWYTGTIIWKTQNPWTAMRGQMYDYYLDPNACLYGLRNGSAPLHVMYNPVDGMVMVANNTFEAQHDRMLVIKAYDMAGKDSLLTQVFVGIEPTTTKKYLSVKEAMDKLGNDRGVFLSLQLLDANKNLISDNFYWLPDAKGDYSGLKQLAPASVRLEARQIEKGKIEVTLSNPGKGCVAFFNRVSLLDPQTKKRILPAFYSDNYVSVPAGSQKKITIEYTPTATSSSPQVALSGWNVAEQVISVK